MRTYSRARRIDVQLADAPSTASHSVDHVDQDASGNEDAFHADQDGDHGAYDSLTLSLARIRRHLEQPADAELTDDDVPRFVSAASEARKVPVLMASRGMLSLQRRTVRQTWLPIMLFFGCIAPTLAGLGLLVGTTDEFSRLATRDAVFGTIPASVAQADAELTRIDTEIAADVPIIADAPAAPARAAMAVLSSAIGSPSMRPVTAAEQEQPPRDIVQLIELTAPATESAAMGALRAIAQPPVEISVPSPLTAAGVELAILLDIEAAAAVPLLDQAITSARADMLLGPFAIAWANEPAHPLALTPPRAYRRHSPRSVARMLAPPAPFIAAVPLATERPLESLVVGSIRNTSARQMPAKPRPRPKPRFAVRQSNGAVVQAPVAVPALPLTKPGALAGIKRKKPRPEPKSSAAFLASQRSKQALAKAAKPAAPVTVAAQPEASTKDTLKAWEHNKHLR